jgi:mono/diheme cytochrome c family protein
MIARAWLSAAAVVAFALPFIGGHGYPGVYPNLDRNPIVELETPEAVTDIVLNGRESMPAFEGELPEQKIAAVITYIRQAWHNHASGVTPAQVK